MSFKSTLYPLYFQKLGRIYTEKLFSVGRFIHKTTLFLCLCDEKDWVVRLKTHCKGNEVGHCFDVSQLLTKTK
jgi:hypothetical protein